MNYDECFVFFGIKSTTPFWPRTQSAIEWSSFGSFQLQLEEEKKTYAFHRMGTPNEFVPKANQILFISRPTPQKF